MYHAFNFNLWRTMIRRSGFAVLLMAVMFAIGAGTAKAQTTATINGTVLDESGAAIPDAKVTLTNDATKAKREVASNGVGAFVFPGINPGSYTVEVAVEGFNGWKQTGLEVNAGDTRSTAAINLKVSSAGQSVTVESSQSEIRPEDSGERAAVLSSRDIQRLAIQSRNLSELLKVLPGVTSTSNGISNGTGFNFNDAGSSGSAVGSGLSANGAPYRGGTAYLLDGVNIIDPGCACWSIAVVNPDMTQEVKVQTSNFGADSQQGPVMINSISKSGGAQFHGLGYLYLRNGVFNSNKWQSANQGVARPEDAYYYPGGSIGGPILIPKTNFNKNRNLLFWVGYEYFWQNLGAASPLQSYVPTDDMRSGNFSATSANSALCASDGGISSGKSNYCDDLTGTIAPDGTKLTGSQIPSKYLDPGAVALLKLFPAANITPSSTGSGYNYFKQLQSQHNGYIIRGRVDYSFSERTKLYVAYQYGSDLSVAFARQYYTPSYAIEYPGGFLQSPTRSKILSGNLIHVFSPSVTNELRAAWGHMENPVTVPHASSLAISTLGYPYQPVFSGVSSLVPSINSPGARTLPDISQPDIFNGGAYNSTKQTWSVADDVNWLYRNHSFKFGFYGSSAGNKQGAQGAANGSLSFASGQRTDPNTGLVIGSNNPLANFLMGITSSFSQVSSNPVSDMSYLTFSGYGLDNWKVTPRFTLNLGVRVDHIGRWKDNGNTGLATWLPDLYTSDVAAGRSYPGLRWKGVDSSIRNSGAPIQAAFVSPRLGFAYDARGNGSTVLRGGWGMYRWNDQYNDYAGALQTAQGVRTYSSTSGQYTTLSEVNAIGATGSVTGSLPASAYATANDDDQLGTTYAYSMTLSQRLPLNSLLEVAYVGNRTQHMLMGGQSSGTNIGGLQFTNQNKIPIGGLFKQNPVTQAAAPTDPEQVSNIVDYYPYYQGYGTNALYVGRHEGFANYNGLQVSWLKQAGRLSFNINYTYSRALGIVNGLGTNTAVSGASVDAFHVRGNYGILNIDRPQVFNASYAYSVGNIYKGSHKLVQGATNGWFFSGITTYQTGGSLLAQYQQNLGLLIKDTTKNETLTGSTYFGTPFMSIMPTVTCDPKSNLHGDQKINMACLSAPAVGSQGVSPTPYLNGPAYWNSDIAVYKTFHITEGQTVEFRWSAFNFLNHPLTGFNSSDLITLKMNTADGKSFTPQIDPSTLGTTDTKTGQRIMQFALKYAF